MEAARQRLTARRKFQVYLETRAPGANVGEILRRFGLHVNDLRRIEASVEAAAVDALRGKRNGHVQPSRVSPEGYDALVTELQEKEHALAQLMVEYTLLKKHIPLERQSRTPRDPRLGRAAAGGDGAGR